MRGARCPDFIVMKIFFLNSSCSEDTILYKNKIIIQLVFFLFWKTDLTSILCACRKFSVISRIQFYCDIYIKTSIFFALYFLLKGKRFNLHKRTVLFRRFLKPFCKTVRHTSLPFKHYLFADRFLKVCAWGEEWEGSGRKGGGSLFKIQTMHSWNIHLVL